MNPHHCLIIVIFVADGGDSIVAYIVGIFVIAVVVVVSVSVVFGIVVRVIVIGVIMPQEPWSSS